MEGHNQEAMQRSRRDTYQQSQGDSDQHTCIAVVIISDGNDGYDCGESHQGAHGKIDTTQQHNEDGAGYQDSHDGDGPQYVGDIVDRREAVRPDDRQYNDK